MAEATITPMANGPYLVQGPVKLTDAEGKEFEVQGKTIALCRCGASSNKPFCDGTHAKVGFKADSKAR